MSGFLSRYPAVDFSFLEGSPSAVQDWLVQGRCDVALMYDLDVRDGLSSHRLFTVRPKVLVAEDFVGPGEHSITLAGLADQPMILIDISPGEAFYRAILSTAGVSPRVVHKTSSVEGVRALVARGFGWSMLLQQSDEVPAVALLAVTLHGRLARRTAAFRDYCTKQFVAAN
jgi:DNA-binding transcriptional LysR family regulator